MKKFLLSMMAASLAAGAFAETSTMDFTYANGELFNYGKGKTETIDVAMRIEEPSLAGMKITGIQAYISTTEGMSDASLWLSNSLTLSGRNNAPDIASYSVEPVAATFEGNQYGLLSIELAEPYVLTTAPVYVGYTVTVDKVTTDAQKNPIVLADNVNSDGLYLHMTKSATKWVDSSDKAGGVAFITAFVEGDFPEYSLGFKGYSTIYANKGEEFQAEFFVSNIGVSPVSSFSYAYSINGADTQENTVALPTPVKPSMTNATPVILTFDGIDAVGSHDLQVWITEVDGQPNSSQAASLQCTVNIVPFIATKRPLVEEYTGLWCGWCPRGFVAMELIAEKYKDDQVSICFHNGDPMAVTDYYPVNVSGFPSATIDRTALIDPYYGSYNSDFGISLNLEEAMAELAIADIEVEASLTKSIIDVKSTSSFIQNLNNDRYQVGYVLVANGLQNNSWAQHSYYTDEDASDYTGTALEFLCELPGNIYGWVYNDVAVDVSGMMGVDDSLPAEIVAGEEYESTFMFDIQDNKVIQNNHNLVAVAYIIDVEEGVIVNANKCDVTVIDDNAVGSVMEDTSIVKTEYFDLSGRRIQNPADGICLRRVTLSDGTTVTSKIIK